ncbi:MAG: diguanylate cyclase [Comamonadaceae bacterium]|nr:MAG: diguanylate cyclase [Comamonadaceae bacterium]
MRSSLVRAAGAFLLWCASWAGASSALADVPAQPERIGLSRQAVVHLNGKSVFWVDTGARGIDDVEASAASLPWQVRRREHMSRLDDSAVWIQFEATSPPGEHWYVEVGATVYDRVQLFYRDRAGKWVMQEAGTQQPVELWSVPGRLPTFALAVDDPAPVRYWLRVEDERADFSAPLTLFREDALQQSREQEQFLFGAFSGLASLVALAALANGLMFRDKALLAFTLYAVLLCAGQLGRAGIGPQYLWPDWPIWNATMMSLWPGAAAAAALWFVKVVTNPARVSRALDLAVWALIAALLAAVALDLSIASRPSMTLVLTLTGLSLLALLGMLAWGWFEAHDRYLRWVAIGFAPVLLLALFPLGRALGLVPTSEIARFGLFFGAALQLPILYYALNLRLMARREGELRARALSRSDALTGLPHRQALIERLDTSLAHARAQKQNCALLGVRIANLQAVAEEFGREAAEKALVVAASHLRRCIVGFDMAARVGERDFAVLLEAPMTPQIATSRAQQIVASGLRQMPALPAALTLKFHVVVAMLPDPHMDGEATLDWVVEGLGAITPETRKAIRALNVQDARVLAPAG